MNYGNNVGAFVAEIVCTGAHNLHTGQLVAFEASSGLTGIPCTNGTGSTTVSLSNAGSNSPLLLTVWVTGLDTFAVLYSSGNITSLYDGNANQIVGSTSVSGSPTVTSDVPDAHTVPWEACAYVTGQFPNANMWVNISGPANDATVQAIAQRVRDNFPMGARSGSNTETRCGAASRRRGTAGH